MLFSKHNGILIVCKDTGAANALSVLLKDWKTVGIPVNSLCISHAVKVFRKRGIRPTKEYPNDITRKEITLVLDKIKPKAIMLGTSLDSETERICCVEARKHKIFCMAFVDWWSNFGARFSTPNTNDLAYLPDVIAVPDEDARLGCIADRIPSELLHITGNPYWDYLKNKKRDLRQLRKNIRKKLYIHDKTIAAVIFSSNIRNLKLNLGYDEHDFWKAITPLPKFSKRGIPICWILKPHPRENKEETRNILKRYHVNLKIVDNLSALEITAAADIVIGMCSSTLFEAALIGKKVISLQPNLNNNNQQYLRIFDHLSIPKIIKVTEVKNILNVSFNDELKYPDLNKIPPPICDGTASLNLEKLLLAGMQK